MKDFLNLKRIAKKTIQTYPLSKEATVFLSDRIPAEKVKEVASILKYWRNRKSLYFTTLQNFYGTHPSGHDFVTLVRTLDVVGVDEWKETCLATWALGIVPVKEGDKEEAHRALRITLDDSLAFNNHAFRRSLSRAFSRTLNFSIPLALTCLILNGSLEYFLRGIGAFLIVFAFLIIMAISTVLISTLLLLPIWCFSQLFDIGRQRRIQYFAALSLGRLGMPESVGILAKSSLHSNRSVSRISFQSLKMILPTVTPDHYGRLPGDAVNQLCKLMNRFHNQSRWHMPAGHDFNRPVRDTDETCLEHELLMILQVLEMIGDSNALRTVRELSKESDYDSVKCRATDLIPILEERSQNENDKVMLLRGSAEPKNPDTLLRPATATPNFNPDELLRPESEPDTDGSNYADLSASSINSFASNIDNIC